MSENTSGNSPKKGIIGTHRAILEIIAITLAILSIIFSTLMWRAHYISGSAQQHTSTLLQQHITTTKATFEDFRKKINSLKNEVSTLQSTLNQLSKMSQQTQNQRILNEIKSLIHRANLQLVINHNPISALQVLKLALVQLKTVTLPDRFTLQKALNKDINILEKNSKLDPAQLLVQLNQLKINIQNIPDLPAQPFRATKPSNSKKTTIKPWYKKLIQNFSSLKELVVIKRDTKIVKPLLSTQQLMFLKQNVQLQIAQAEWAVLHQNKILYQQSLTRAKKMLQAHYPDQNRISSTINNIDALLKINISPPLPEFMNTLNILNHLISMAKVPL